MSDRRDRDRRGYHDRNSRSPSPARYRGRSRSRSRSDSPSPDSSRKRDKRDKYDSKDKKRSKHDEKDDKRRHKSSRRHRHGSRSRSASRSLSPDTSKLSSSVDKTQSIESVPSAAEIVARKAQQLSKDLNITSASNAALDEAAALKAARTKEIQEQIAAQIAAVSSMLSGYGKAPIPVPSLVQPDRKAAYIPLVLDAQGRPVDAKGNVIKENTQIKTLAANAALSTMKRKKENPYLSHRGGGSGGPSTAALPETDELSSSTTSAVVIPTEDPRVKIKNRDVRAKRSFNFVEAGTYMKQADQARFKEERKMIAGYASGRRAPEPGENVNSTNIENLVSTLDTLEDASMTVVQMKSGAIVKVPPPADEGIVPALEWWNEAFLPKSLREVRQRSRAAQENDDFEMLSFTNCKTVRYVQHPVAVRPLGGEKPEEPLKLYLTKKERKRIRRSARAEREREKRDKMLMGLIPAPEPKFKLSNFMKIIGDQAVADPSKVEQKVIKQMKQRVLNHEMRNQARKLTPSERKEKKRKKLIEDTSRQVHVAIFCVRDFSDPKHRFKIDVNAQQLNLTGTVLLCPAAQCNLIVLEGGPKGIKKIIRVVMKRVTWIKSSAAELDHHKNRSDNQAESLNRDENDNQERNDDEEEDVDDNDSEEGDNGTNTVQQAPESDMQQGAVINLENNRCDFLWQGIVAKRTFHAFRFQECRSSSSARKVLEAKGLAHYWDMASRVENIISTAEIN